MCTTISTYNPDFSAFVRPLDASQMEDFLGLGKAAKERRKNKQSRKDELAEAKSYAKKTEADATLLGAQAQLEMAKSLSNQPFIPSSARAGESTAREGENLTADDLILGLPKVQLFSIGAVGVVIILIVVFFMFKNQITPAK